MLHFLRRSTLFIMLLALGGCMDRVHEKDLSCASGQHTGCQPPRCY